MTIKQKANREAKTLVNSMFWQLPERWKNELGFVIAKGCAIVAVRKMMKIRTRSYYGVPGNWAEDYLVLKALPKAINELKYKPVKQ